MVRAAQNLYVHGRYGEARSLLEAAVERDPDELSARVNLAVVLYGGMGQSERAAAVLEEAVRRDSSRVDVYLLLGKIRLSLEQANAAVEALTVAARRQPGAAENHLWLGVAQLQAGKAAASIAALQRAAEKAPLEATAHLHLARAYEVLGQHDAAERERWIFGQLRPSDERVQR